MNRDNLIKLILDKNWILISEGLKYDLYKPPTEMGFNENFSLPVPRFYLSEDYDKTLHETIKFILNLYDIREEEFYEKSSGYFNVLLNNAIYFKLKSENVKYEKTLEVNEIWNFLKNLSTSYTNYIKINFERQFSDYFGFDSGRINKALFKFLNLTKLRVVALEYKSFSFGVSADIMMGTQEIQNKDISEWRRRIVKEYNDEVIDINYNSEEFLNLLTLKYNDNERRLIYTPIIKSINNPSNYTISLTNKNFEPQKFIKRLSKQTIDYFIPKDSKAIEENETTINFIKTIIPVDSSKNIIKLNVSDLEHESLFTQKLEEISGQIIELNIGVRKIKLNIPVNFTLSYNPYNTMFSVLIIEPNLKFDIKNFNNLQKEFDEKIIEMIQYFKMNKKFDSYNDKFLFKFLQKILPENEI